MDLRGSSSFVINADSCIVKVQGFIFYFTLTCRNSPPHLTSLGTIFFLIPQLLLRRRSARCARLPPAQSLCHVYYDEFFGSPQFRASSLDESELIRIFHQKNCPSVRPSVCPSVCPKVMFVFFQSYLPNYGSQMKLEFRLST